MDKIIVGTKLLCIRDCTYTDKMDIKHYYFIKDFVYVIRHLEMENDTYYVQDSLGYNHAVHGDFFYDHFVAM